MSTINDFTILLIDDEEDILDFLKIDLSSYAKGILTASTAAKALEYFNSYKIEVVLLDIKMPGMDGLMLLREIKQKSPNTVVIMLTSADSKENILSAMRFGAFDFLDKPINKLMLKLCINKALERSFYDSLSVDVLDLMQECNLLFKESFSAMDFNQKKDVIKLAFSRLKERVFK